VTLRLVLADDSVLVREGVARLLVDAGFEVVAQVGDADALLRATREHLPDVAIVDIRMPPTHTDEGLRAAQAIRAEHGTAVGILVLSQHVEPSFAMRLVSDGAGGVGYLLKDRIMDVDDFVDAVRRVAGGGTALDPEVVAQLFARQGVNGPLGLTEREREVLALMAEGRSNQAIGDRLSMARKTVEAHIANIFSKLELPPTSDDHRRVLAVLAHLRGPGPSRT
jgi:DNA-binding NarL/FixJ family response regulator